MLGDSRLLIRSAVTLHRKGCPRRRPRIPACQVADAEQWSGRRGTPSIYHFHGASCSSMRPQPCKPYAGSDPAVNLPNPGLRRRDDDRSQDADFAGPGIRSQASGVGRDGARLLTDGNWSARTCRVAGTRPCRCGSGEQYALIGNRDRSRIARSRSCKIADRDPNRLDALFPSIMSGWASTVAVIACCRAAHTIRQHRHSRHVIERASDVQRRRSIGLDA